MIDILLLEKILSILFNNEIYKNETFKKDMNKISKKATTESEINTIELIIEVINCNYLTAFNLSKLVNKKESNDLTTPCFILYHVFYIILLVRLHDQDIIDIKEKDLSNYAKSTKYLFERLVADGEYKKYLWLSYFLEGYLFFLFDYDFAIVKLRQAIETSQNYKYKEFPISFAYDRLGLLYYEKGYFDKAKSTYNKAIKIWENSNYLLNNRAFLLYVMKDEQALEALKAVYQSTNMGEPYSAFNLASYKLFANIEIDNVQSLLKEAFEGFIEDYKIKKDTNVILDIFTCSVLESIAHDQTSSIVDEDDELTIEMKESQVTKKLFLNLFSDIENFLSSTYEINKRLSSFLRSEKTISNDENIFVVLKRWSSFTPLIPQKAHSSRGGGHFFTWKGKGFVVDPGPNFLENFSENEFRLSDIDCIICSHGHVDHTQDIEKIITLLYEKNNVSKTKQKIRLLLSPGNASKYGSLLSASNDVIESCVVLYPDKKISIDEFNISISPTLSNHFEIFSRADNALSFIISLNENNIAQYSIGFTNDTGFTGDYNKNIESFFKDDPIDLLIANIGSISFNRLINLARITMLDTWWTSRLSKSPEILKALNNSELLETLGYRSFNDFKKHFIDGAFSDKHDWYETHLGFRGVFRLAVNSNYSFMILSEFGEELKYFRHLIARTLNSYFNETNKIITGDIGTKFLFTNNKVLPFCDLSKDYTENNIIEKVVKHKDYQIIHFDETKLEKQFYRDELNRIYGHLI